MKLKRGRPKSKNPKARGLHFRVDQKEMNRILWLARNYADGDVSKWLRHAAINCDRKFLVKKKALKKRA